jgi:hypothetical protein
MKEMLNIERELSKIREESKARTIKVSSKPFFPETIAL